MIYQDSSQAMIVAEFSQHLDKVARYFLRTQSVALAQETNLIRGVCVACARCADHVFSHDRDHFYDHMKHWQKLSGKYLAVKKHQIWLLTPGEVPIAAGHRDWYKYLTKAEQTIFAESWDKFQKLGNKAKIMSVENLKYDNVKHLFVEFNT